MAAYRVEALSSMLAHPSRRAILQHLRPLERTVSELVALTGLRQPNVSNHLSRLRAEGVVASERNGRSVYYRLEPRYVPLFDRLNAASGGLRTVSGGGSASGSSSLDLSMSQHLAHYAAALAAGDSAAATEVVERLLAASVDLVSLYSEIMEPALARIGDAWRCGSLGVGDEHCATEITLRLMARAAHYCLPPTHGSLVAVIGCVEGARHSVGSRMLADALGCEGWITRYLGADVPAHEFIRVVATTRPDLVCVACTLECEWPAAVELLQRLSSLADDAWRPSLAVGGRYVNSAPSVLDEVPFALHAPSLRMFVERVRSQFGPVGLPDEKDLKIVATPLVKSG